MARFASCLMAGLLATSAASSNGMLSLKWSDCGSTKKHAKITDFSPLSLDLGQVTTMTGHGNLDEQVTAAKYELSMTGAIGTMLHCTGDASQPKACPLPMGFGSLTMKAMAFPMSPGVVPVSVDIDISARTPKMLQTTETIAKATDQNGEEIFCIKIESAPAVERRDAENEKDEVAEVVVESLVDTVSQVLESSQESFSTAPSNSMLSLKWSDCGSAKKHAKITDFNPLSLALGQATTMTGHGNLDEPVTAAKYELSMTGRIGTMLHCTGDASQPKACPLPMGFGSLTMKAMAFPMSPGVVPVSVDIDISARTPKMLQTTETVAKATDQNGEEIFCIKIESAPAGAVMVV